MMHFHTLILGAALATATRVFSESSGNSFGVPENATYDYVIVGGGTAGNAIALRLAEDPSNRVAVIEAGGFYQFDSGNRSVVPGYAFSGQAPGTKPSPLTDWDFYTTSQPALMDRTLPYARGKTLGGSSALNYMAYHRGTIGSYQSWADAVGDDSYEWNNILQYFEKSSTFTPPNNQTRFANSTPTYEPAAFNNSLNGPLQVSYPAYSSAIASWFQLGFEAIGIPVNSGFSFGSLFGADWSEATIDPKTGHRSSSQTSYLDRAIENTTLMVYTHSLARRILFDSNKTATGIEVQTGDQTYTLSAVKEVILSAGAFQSPQLLMVSGIGPEDTLSSLNISTISKLPGVGQNMWDHLLFSTSYAVNVETATLLMNTSSPYTYAAEAEYNQNATGPLTNAAPYLAWEKLPQPQRADLANTTLAALSEFPSDWPEVEFLVQTAYVGELQPPSDDSYATLATALVAPLSRGNVSINSTSILDPPIINPNWLTNASDVDLAIQAFKRQRQLWASADMQRVVIGLEFQPGMSISTDEEIEQYIRQSAGTVYHASCTCKMGIKEDEMAVVDSQARVFGVQGLRIVDASAFPLLPPGHPQATIYMLAEKIADDIKRGR